MKTDKLIEVMLLEISLLKEKIEALHGLRELDRSITNHSTDAALERIKASEKMQRAIEQEIERTRER